MTEKQEEWKLLLCEEIKENISFCLNGFESKDETVQKQLETDYQKINSFEKRVLKEYDQKKDNKEFLERMRDWYGSIEKYLKKIETFKISSTKSFKEFRGENIKNYTYWKTVFENDDVSLENILKFLNFSEECDEYYISGKKGCVVIQDGKIYAEFDHPKGLRKYGDEIGRISGYFKDCRTEEEFLKIFENTDPSLIKIPIDKERVHLLFEEYPDSIIRFG